MAAAPPAAANDPLPGVAVGAGGTSASTPNAWTLCFVGVTAAVDLLPRWRSSLGTAAAAGALLAAVVESCIRTLIGVWSMWPPGVCRGAP